MTATYSDSIVVQFDTVSNGNAGSLKPVTVFHAGTTNKAALTDLIGTPIDNPVIADDKGNYTFNVADGIYDIFIDYGLSTQTPILNQLIGERAVDVQLINDLSQAYEFKTLQDAVDFDQLIEGKVCHLAERTMGNGGGATWDAVDIGTVTPNGFNIVACTGVPTLALKLKVEHDTVEASKWGIVYGGPTDNGAAIKNLLESDITNIIIEDVAGLSTRQDVTLVSDKIIKGNGSIKWIGTALANNMIRVICDGNNFESQIKWDGNNLASGCLRVENSTVQTGDLPNCTIKDGAYGNVLMSTQNIYNYGVHVRGSFENVLIDNNDAANFDRLAGTGVIGSSGTSATLITGEGTSLYPKNILHKGNRYSGMSSQDTPGVNDVDTDYLLILIPDPTNFPNGDSSFNEYPPITVESHSNIYNNPIGRAEKYQCVPWSHHNTIIRKGGRTMNAGSNDINCQWGVGVVEDITWELGGSTSPITTELIPVSFFNSTDYGEIKGAVTCRRITINNNIPASLNNVIDTIVSVNTAAETFSKDVQQVVLHDITMAGGKCRHLTFSRWINAVVPISIENISLQEVLNNFVGIGDSGANLDIVANNVRQFGTPVEFINNYGGGDRVYSGRVSGGIGLFGVIQPYEFGASFGSAPMLSGGALSDGNKNPGGALSVQSVSLDDDESHKFDSRGYVKGNYILSINTNFAGAASIMNCVGASGSIDVFSETPGVFATGAGVNPDTDGLLNIWIDSDGNLNFKNRLGSTRVLTVVFKG